MAEIATIARPYAEAVFKVADGEGRLAAWADVIARLAAIAANPAVAEIVGDPNVDPDQLYGCDRRRMPAICRRRRRTCCAS